ncbi:glycosyltransferase [Halorubrum sp. CBA1125]|uniref:glycosyltransferase family 4 protein n=1 Tax=Halorubrum sp. CBA1125 TaxID=2668072 RepID=UPI0012E91374|nr:glycosyltransferase [Halorubrum sp. CBA1125]MUW13219.1 glycosyltransferase [Halorubrum sp. CBA1125]
MNKRKNPKPRIGIVVISEQLTEKDAAFTAIQNFINIFGETTESITIFGPERTAIKDDQVYLQSMKRYGRPTLIHEFVYHFYLQLRLTFALIRSRNDMDAVFFHLGGTVLLLPILFSRVLGLNPIVIVTGSVKTSYIEQHEQTIGTKVMTETIGALEKVSCGLASKVVFLSESMKSEFREINDDRITVANLNYIDTSDFDSKISESKREYDLIYLGRFERVKGVKKFAQAVSILVENHSDIQVAFVGDGTLGSEVENIITENNLNDNVERLGWVNRKKVKELLGNSRYLVLPSESEGVPKTLLEAMSCGTVPIATQVGGIPDIIKHEETGFLLSSNEPNQMAREIDQYIKKEMWDNLSFHAREYIISRYSFENSKERFRSILQEALSD